MKKQFLLTVLIALAAGTGAGICAAVVTSQSLNDYTRSLLADKQLPTVDIQQPTPIPGTYEEALSRVRENAKTGIVTLMPTSVDSVFPKDWKKSASALGFGAVVSGDGWIAVDASVIDGVKDPVKEIDVWIAGTRYSVTSVVRDTATSVVMMHTSATGLAPLGFAATAGARSGVMMFAVDGMGGITPDAVVQSDMGIGAEARPAEQFATTWTLSGTLPEKSMPLLNAAGELAGFAQKGSMTALPLHHALSTVRSIVRTGASSEAMLGAYIVDLAHEFNINPDLKQHLRAGALVLAPDAVTHATVRGGPAAEAGFAAKDIILAVDGESLTEFTSLAEILSSYTPGSTAKCTVLRAGQTITIAVVLSDATTVVY